MKMALAAMIVAAFAAGSAVANDPPMQARKTPMMQLQSAYPVVVTDKMAECRDFYVRHFGFEVAFEATWFVYLSAGGGQPYAIAFMTPDHPSRPPGPEKFDGKGLFLTLQVDDAAKEFERLRKTGATIAYPVADEPWGQRRFGVVDPSGLWVDVVQQIEPAPGYWDPYMRIEPTADSSQE